jgi:hypothetical protein
MPIVTDKIVQQAFLHRRACHRKAVSGLQVVVMDETGACWDCQHIDRIPDSSSAMMAVIIPSGSQLPPCPYGYHSIESKEDSKKLRKHLLAKAEIVVLLWPYEAVPAPMEPSSSLLKAEIVVLLWPYEEASPYARSDEKNLSLHAQMWRHAVTLCLEYIAQQVAGESTKQNLRLYIEQQSENPAGSNPLQGIRVTLWIGWQGKGTDGNY